MQITRHNRKCMQRSIRHTLIVLISLTVLLPILVMFSGVFISIERGINRTVIERNELMAKSIALSIEQQIRDASTLLMHTTTYGGSIDSPDFKAFLESSLIKSGIFESLFIINEDGIVHYSIPYNEIFTGFDFSQQAIIQQVLKRSTTDPVYSAVFISTLTKNPTLMVAVHQPGKVFAGYVNLAWLSRLSDSLSNARLTYLSIVDRYGTTIANTNRAYVEEQYSIANTDLFLWAQKEKQGTKQHNFNSNDMLSSVRFVPGPDWYIFISEPTSSALKATRDVFIIGLLVTTIALIVAAIVGYVVGRDMLQSITALTEETRQVQAGVYRSITSRSPYIELNRLIDTFNAMSEEVWSREQQYEEANRQLQDALKQKDILLREVHHRVKNNMQIVSSLLALQSDELSCEEDKEYFEHSKLRIQSMAIVHEKIYQTDGVESLPLKAYIQDLVELLQSNNQNYFQYTVSGDELSITLNQAIPCALTVFEACTNAIKYGLNIEKKYLELSINIALREDNQVCIHIKDSGPGFPDGFNPAEINSLGFTLMKGLMEQLKGTISWYTNNGAVVELNFPLHSNNSFSGLDKS